MCYIKLLVYAICVSFISDCHGVDSLESAFKLPTIAVTILVRNKAHSLPYFLTCLYNLDYPKDRMFIWIHSDFNEDNSDEVLETWVEKHAMEYNGIKLTTNICSGPLHPDEDVSTNWSPLHYEHVIKLRENALQFARNLWADFIFMLDADVFLTNRTTLQILVNKNLPVVAPMLLSEGLYSNFWCGMNEDLYYLRTADYEPIQSREAVGCFEVPMVHTALLASLRRTGSDALSYLAGPSYRGPQDDIIVFAVNAKRYNIPLFICNDHDYGYLPVPVDDGADPAMVQEQVLNVKMKAIARRDPLPLDADMAQFVTYPQRWTFRCSAIYVINLERRPEKRELMEMSFKELGMEVTYLKAVDGKDLSLDTLEERGIHLMPGYQDPYHKRPMKLGEIGCFLSHYKIWKLMEMNDQDMVMVLEDDIDFVPYFRSRFLRLMDEIKDIQWDILYLGRKLLMEKSEAAVTPRSVRPLYSYWTLGYVVRAAGARKLVAADPLRRMLPVDEFLPIMFDQHPNSTWKAHFPQRDLIALSASPLLVHPTHYTGEPGYISDTEDSNDIDAIKQTFHTKNKTEL